MLSNQKKYILTCDSFYRKFQKTPSFYSDRKPVSGRGGVGVQEGDITRGQEDTFAGDGHVQDFDCGDGFMGEYKM